MLLPGIGVALGAGLASFPLCFDINATLWFNDLYVTTDVADSKDLETPLEVTKNPFEHDSLAVAARVYVLIRY